MFWYEPIEDRKAAFIREMNEMMEESFKIVEIEHDYPKFKVEGTEPISNIFIKGRTFEQIVERVASKYFRRVATFRTKDNTFWFFAQV